MDNISQVFEDAPVGCRGDLQESSGLAPAYAKSCVSEAQPNPSIIPESQPENRRLDLGVQTKHRKELLEGSAIAPEVAALNFTSLDDAEEIIERLAGKELEALGSHGQQYATKPVQEIFKRYESVARGGWWVTGLDPLQDWGPMQWGQFKPDFPRQGWRKDEQGNWKSTGDVIKYESPKGEQVRALFLQAPNIDWAAVLADKSASIVICEGGKKAACLLSLGIPAIALIGVDGWSFRDEDDIRRLLPELELFCNPERLIVFAFDADTKKTAIKRVEAAKRGLCHALIGAGVRTRNIRLAYWDSGLGKGIDDVIAAHGPESWARIEANAQTYREFKADGIRKVKAAKRGLFELVEPPAIVLDERYLPTINLPAPGGILAMDSAMETGKTEVLKKLKEQFFAAHPGGYFDVAGYRNGLGRQTAKRISADHLHDIGAGAHTQTLIDHTQSLSYCLDSLHRRAAGILRAIANGQTVAWVLDEVDAVIRHLLVGGTLGGRRQQIQGLFAEVVRAITANGGYIICGEADLPQLPLSFLKDLTGADTTIIQNTHIPQKWNVAAPMPLSKEGHEAPTLMREAAFQGVIDAVKNKQRGPIFFGTDDQKLGEILDRTLTNQGFIVWRLDGNTSEEEWARAFMDDPNGHLAEHGVPDLLIVTTTAESGLSIDEGWFAERIIYGSHLEYRALLQQSGRPRGDTPLSIYAADSVRPSDDNPASFNYQDILKTWQQNASDSALSIGIQHQATADDAAAIRGAVEGDGELFHTYAARYRARHNISGAALRTHLLDTLAAQGHCIHDDELIEISPESRELYQDGCLELNIDRADTVADTPADQTVEWAKKILTSNSASKKDRIKAEKILLLDDYPGLPADDPEFIYRNLVQAGGTLLKAHTLAWLCNHPKVAKQIDLNSWRAQLKNSYIWLPSIKRESVKVHALASSGLLEVAALDTYCETTPEVVTAAQWALEHAPLLNRLFRLNIKANQTNIHIVNKLLKKIGYKADIDNKIGGRGEQIKIWKIQNADDCDRNAIWEALTRKWADLLKAENVDTEAVSAPVDSICNSNKPYIQIESTAPKTPTDKGRGGPKFSPGDVVRWGWQVGRWTVHAIHGDTAHLIQLDGVPGYEFTAPVKALMAASA